MKVYDGSDDGSRLLWTHSGDGPPPGPFQSTANSLFMTFVTNESLELTGFWVSYATVICYKYFRAIYSPFNAILDIPKFNYENSINLFHSSRENRNYSAVNECNSQFCY